MKYSLFLDESCHLQGDKSTVMCIGYIKLPEIAKNKLADAINVIKSKHRTPFEVKWQKFSKSRMSLYKDLVDFFFDMPMEFSCVTITDKDRLESSDFNNGSPDNYYYRMVYFLLKPSPVDSAYRVFIDLKDTRGKEKLNKIEEIFNSYHRGNSPFVHFQHLQSHDSVFFQIADFFIGAITYKTRRSLGELKPNEVKDSFIEYFEQKSGYMLHQGTTPWEDKFNIFRHQPKIRN